MKKLKKLPPLGEVHKININESYSEGQKIMFNEPVKYKDTLFQENSTWEIRKVDSMAVRLHDLMIRKDWIGVSVEIADLDKWMDSGKIE